MKEKRKKIIAIGATILAALAMTVVFDEKTPPLFAQQIGAADDMTPPSDVILKTAIAGDTKITLEWEPATDNTGVSGYKIYLGTASVKNPGQQYDLPAVAVGNVTNHTLEGLTNGKKHYLAVTAVDAAGNESVNFGGEAEATPNSTGTAAIATNNETSTAHASADSEAPKLTAGSADFGNRILLTFSEKIKLPENPRQLFSVARKDTGATLRIINVSLGVDGKTVFLVTDPQQTAEYIVKTTGVKDLTGNEAAAASSSITVTGRGASLEDFIAPEDAQKFKAKAKRAGDNIVELAWEGSKNSSGDLADQLLYQSDDRRGAKYGAPASLGTSTREVEVADLTPGRWYTFKLTAKDQTGNESRGIITSIFLPQTGPGVVAAGLAALAAGWYRKRKKK